jgi:hypothetical protein
MLWVPYYVENRKLCESFDCETLYLVNVSRHIRENMPFKGSVSYTMRAHSYDNEITQLVRHTIEHIRSKEHGSFILINDRETKSLFLKSYKLLHLLIGENGCKLSLKISKDCNIHSIQPIQTYNNFVCKFFGMNP